ncbi:MAG: DMT family transporter [Thermoleophilia bacterium]
MARGYVLALVAFAALWGANFAFIKIAVRQIEPSTMGAARLLLAAAALFPVALVRYGLAETIAGVRRIGWRLLLLGTLNHSAAFLLIAWGEKHIDSGVAAIANATVPLFVALLAIRWSQSERASGLRLVGIAVGMVGVGVLTGFHPEGGTWAILGTLAVVLAAVVYSIAGLYTQSRYAGTPPLVLAVCSTTGGGLVLLPAAIVQAPSSMPDAGPLGATIALGLAGTAAASILYYHLLTTYGSLRTGFATYVLPIVAVGYGAAFLGESLSWSAAIGLALILAGVALGSGLLRRRRAEPAGPIVAAERNAGR